MTGTDGPVWARGEEEISTDGPVWARPQKDRVWTGRWSLRDGIFWELSITDETSDLDCE